MVSTSHNQYSYIFHLSDQYLDYTKTIGFANIHKDYNNIACMEMFRFPIIRCMK